VLVREPAEHRRAVCRDLGIDADTSEASAPRSHVVFECTGQPQGFQSALTATAKSGPTEVVGVHPHPQPVDLCLMVVEERNLVASLSHSLDDDYRPAIELLASGQIIWEPLVSDRIALDRVVDHGFGRLIDDPQAHVKVLVDCRG
jgi:(R,R)-butanediol dehydrogenase/meso-butanediol dehydrogenase/diacetyl reductase